MRDKIKEVKAGKKIVTNLGNYNSYHVSCELTVEVEEGKRPDWDAIWDEVNQQIEIEQTNLDPRWIKKEEFKNHRKLTIKIPKRKETK